MKRKIAAKYSNDQLMKAIEAVKSGSSKFAAAKKYGIPRSTLFNKISGKSQIGKKSGPGTVMTMKEEKFIEKWVLCLADRGLPVVKRQLLHSVQMYLNANKRHTPFTNNFPGRKWYKNFLIRHPVIAKRLSQNLIKSRAAVTEFQLKAWHAEVEKYCEENDLSEALNDPNRIFNMDEKGFILTPKNEVVLARRGQKAVYNRSENDEKECVTALLGGNAAGVQTPPMLVYPYKRMPSNILLHLPANWSVGISDNGWQTQQTFFDYISNVFCKWLSESNIKLPVILFIDGHKSHISLTLSDFCSANQIELVALYPNATHVIQPMDVVVFKPLGGSWNIKVKDWKIAHNFAKIDKKDITPILNESVSAIDYAGLLQKGFERCGLYPFNADNINMSRLVPVNTNASQDQFFNDEDASEPEPKQVQNEQGAHIRLKNFEELIDPSTLNLFRSSKVEWKGPIECAALYSIWQKLCADATELMLSDCEETIIIDVGPIDNGTAASSESQKDIENNTTIFFVGENGELFKSDDADRIEIENNRIVVGESVNFAVGDLVKLGVDEECFEESNDEYCQAMTVDQIVSDQQEKLIIGNCSMDMEIEEAQHLVTVACDGSNDLVKATNTTKPQMSISHTESFDEEAFKKSFLMPQPNESKKRKLVPKEKPSTVITSEAWKEGERKKLAEKERKEAEKVARMLEREQKKVMLAK